MAARAAVEGGCRGRLSRLAATTACGAVAKRRGGEVGGEAGGEGRRQGRRQGKTRGARRSWWRWRRGAARHAWGASRRRAAPRSEGAPRDICRRLLHTASAAPVAIGHPVGIDHLVDGHFVIPGRKKRRGHERRARRERIRRSCVSSEGSTIEAAVREHAWACFQEARESAVGQSAMSARGEARARARQASWTCGRVSMRHRH